MTLDYNSNRYIELDFWVICTVLGAALWVWDYYAKDMALSVYHSIAVSQSYITCDKKCTVFK